MTPMRTRWFATGIALMAASPATAGETWDCTTGVFAWPSSTVMHVKVQIDGGTLAWQIQAAELVPGSSPVQSPEGKSQPQTITFHYRILENNAGIIAVASESDPGHGDQPIVYASVLLIRKSDGHFRVENIDIDRPFSEEGLCKPAENLKAP